MIFLALPATAADKPELSGYAIALDADTLRIGTTRIRLYGVSAIEMKDGGHVARAAVDDVISGKRVDCRKVDTDRYKRPVAICAIEDGPADLSEWLLATGNAVTYRAYMDQSDVDDGYLAAERVASEKGLGVWARDTIAASEIFGGIFGAYHREFVTGFIAIFAALLGAAAGAYAGIFEIRRIRSQIKQEARADTASLLAIELTNAHSVLDSIVKRVKKFDDPSRNACKSLIENAQLFYLNNSGNLIRLNNLEAAVVMEAYIKLQHATDVLNHERSDELKIIAAINIARKATRTAIVILHAPYDLSLAQKRWAAGDDEFHSYFEKRIGMDTSNAFADYGDGMKPTPSDSA